MDKVLIFGTSHTNCLARALPDFKKEAGDDISFEVVARGPMGLPGGLCVTNHAGEKIPNPLIDYATQAANMRRGNRIWLISVLAMNNANTTGMFRDSAAPFAVASRAEDGTETVVGSGRVIDEDLIKRGHLARLESHKEGLKTLKSLKPHRVVQLAPYQIMRDPDEIVELLSQFPERLAARGVTADEIQVNPVELRKKIWDMEFEACKIVAEEAEVDFLVSDNHMIGEDGMRGIDSSLDPAHCTPEWGLEILRQLKGHIEQAAG